MWKAIIASGLVAFATLSAAHAEERLLSGAAKEVVHVHITNDEETFLGPFASVSKSCGSLGSAKAQIVQAPQHGVASVKLERGAIAFDDANPLARCNDKPIVGAVIHYSPADGFVGNDGFAVRIVFPNGETRMKWVSVDVGCGCKNHDQVALAD